MFTLATKYVLGSFLLDISSDLDTRIRGPRIGVGPFGLAGSLEGEGVGSAISSEERAVGKGVAGIVSINSVVLTEAMGSCSNTDSKGWDCGVM